MHRHVAVTLLEAVELPGAATMATTAKCLPKVDQPWGTGEINGNHIYIYLFIYIHIHTYIYIYIYIGYKSYFTYVFFFLECMDDYE